MDTQQRASKRKTGLQQLVAGLIGCLCVLTWLSVAQATSVIQLSEAKMVEMSSLVVRGKVLSQRYIKGPNGMGVVTLVTVQVLEEVLGRPAPKQVIVRHFGGMIGKQRIQMIGGPSFANGNEVLVFLQVSKYLPKGEYLLVGLTQGKWIVQRADPKGSAPSTAKQSAAPVVVRSLKGLQLYKTNGKPLQHKHAGHNHVGHKHAVETNRQTLSSLTKRLRGHWGQLQLRIKKGQLSLKPVVRIKKINLPKTKIKVIKNLKLVKPQVRKPAGVTPPQKR